VVDDLADLCQVILGGQPDLQLSHKASDNSAAGRTGVTLPCSYGGFCAALVWIAWACDVRA
jgi:hypothetical protein